MREGLAGQFQAGLEALPFNPPIKVTRQLFLSSAPSGALYLHRLQNIRPCCSLW